MQEPTNGTDERLDKIIELLTALLALNEPTVINVTTRTAAPPAKRK
jgi:hypothetical protein